jgi:hypothetical protein
MLMYYFHSYGSTEIGLLHVQLHLFHLQISFLSVSTDTQSIIITTIIFISLVGAYKIQNLYFTTFQPHEQKYSYLIHGYQVKHA